MIGSISVWIVSGIRGIGWVAVGHTGVQNGGVGLSFSLAEPVVLVEVSTGVWTADSLRHNPTVRLHGITLLPGLSRGLISGVRRERREK